MGSTDQGELKVAGLTRPLILRLMEKKISVQNPRHSPHFSALLLCMVHSNGRSSIGASVTIRLTQLKEMAKHPAIRS